MSISLQALWLVCGIGAVVFSTGPLTTRRAVSAVVGFGLTAWLLRGGSVPDTATVAGFAALLAGCRIYRPSWTAPSAFGGMLAAVLGALLENQGVAAPFAVALAGSIPVLSIALSARNANFAPETMLEEGALLMLALGLGAGAGPAILDGWRSAGALNSAAEAANRAMPAWVLATAGASTLIGGAWSFWRHR